MDNISIFGELSFVEYIKQYTTKQQVLYHILYHFVQDFLPCGIDLLFNCFSCAANCCVLNFHVPGTIYKVWHAPSIYLCHK